MNLHTKLLYIVCISISLVGCTFGNGMICGPQTAIADCDKEAYERLVHPKAYGEYWIKPGMTKESWREDWVACGGMADGNYVAGGRLPGETDDFAASKRKTKQLSTCMRSKGYEYHYTGIVASPKNSKN